VAGQLHGDGAWHAGPLQAADDGAPEIVGQGPAGTVPVRGQSARDRLRQPWRPSTSADRRSWARSLPPPRGRPRR
jgi:hypothetical protein